MLTSPLHPLSVRPVQTPSEYLDSIRISKFMRQSIQNNVKKSTLFIGIHPIRNYDVYDVNSKSYYPFLVQTNLAHAFP